MSNIFRKILVCLMAVLAVSAVAAASASAAEHLEFGRCVAKEGGKYANNSCTTEGAAKEWEWTSVPTGSNIPFTSKSGAGELETVNGVAVKCTSDENVGEVTGPKTDTVKVTFRGCKGPLSTACETTGAGKEVITTVQLSSTLVWLTTTPTPVEGLDLVPAAGTNFAVFNCASNLVETETRGSLLGIITPSSKMTSVFTVTYEQEKGKQKYTKYYTSCPAAPKTDILETQAKGVKPFEWTQSAIKDTDEIKFAKEYEIWQSC